MLHKAAGKGNQQPSHTTWPLLYCAPSHFVFPFLTPPCWQLLVAACWTGQSIFCIPHLGSRKPLCETTQLKMKGLLAIAGSLVQLVVLIAAQSSFVRPTFPSGTRYVGSGQKCGSSNGGAACNVNLCCAYPLNTADFYCGNTANHCGPGRCNPAYGSCWAPSITTTSRTTTRTTTRPTTNTITPQPSLNPHRYQTLGILASHNTPPPYLSTHTSQQT